MSLAELIPEIQMDCQSIIVSVLESVEFEEKAYHRWSGDIATNTLETIIQKLSGYKLIVNCEIMEKTGGEFFSQAVTFWEPKKDGQIVVRWENGDIYVLLTIFALKI